MTAAHVAVDDPVGALLTASSVAVFGASDDATTISGRPLHYLLRSGFSGRIYPVNPTRDTVQGVPCYSSVSSLPETPDVAVVVVRAAAAVEIVRECAERGVAVAVVTSSGFGEAGPQGRDLQERLVEAAGAMRLLGPNCLGAFNAFAGLYATFSQTLMAGFAPAGPVGVATQSGAYGSHLAFLAQQRNLDIGYWVTTGNESDLTVADAVAWMAEQPEITVIVAYVEGVRDGDAFRRALQLAHAHSTPVVVLKTGRSEGGERMAGSHTGALSGADEVFDAVFRDTGAYRAYSIEEQLDVAYACARARPRRVDRLGVVTVSGGVGAHICDAAQVHGLSMPTLPAEVQRDLLELIPYASVANPVDCTGQALQDTRLAAAAFRALLADAQCDAVLGFFSTVPSTPVFAQRLQDAMEQGIQGGGDALLVICMVAGSETVAAYERAGVLVFEDPDRAVRAIAALGQLEKAQAVVPTPATPPSERARCLEARAYSEAEAKALLAEHGLPLPAERLVCSASDAVAAAEEVGYPVAVKIVSRDLAHKSDLGGVALGLADADAVRCAYDAVVTGVHGARPDAIVDGVLVTSMAPPGVELIVGVRVDPVFGPVVMVGLGGIFTEILHDVAVRLAPVDRASARSMVESLGAASVLTGARGREPVDVDAVADTIAALSRFAAEHRDDLSVVELNPVVAYPSGRGVLVLDAVLRGNDER